METAQQQGKGSLWILIVNIAVVAAMVATLALYASSNAQEEAKNNRDMLLESTVNVSDLVRLYFTSQHRSLYNHHCYISPENGDKLSYEQAVQYLHKANADATVNYQLIDPATYCGDSLIDGARVPVDYTYDTYAPIREVCDTVAAGQADHQRIRATPAFANASKGAAACVALYTDVTVTVGGQDRRYVLLAAIETANLVDSGLPSLAYENAGACIIDKNGDYIVRDEADFRNSENLYKFLRIYNSLTYPQADEIAVQMLERGTGILEYNDYRGQPCYYPYRAISGTDGWFYVASVPVASTLRSNFDYVFSLILLFFLGVLITINGLRLKRLNTLLRSNIAHLDEARKTADAASAAKTFFLAHMSHEMRTPLNAIIGMGTLVREKSDDPEIEALLLRMSAASEHLLGIINDVLDISKIGEGKLSLHYEPFSIEELSKVLSSLYGISAGENGVSLMVEDEISVGRYIIGDQLRLRQVMTNLISNAIKYNHPGGYAKVAIRQLGEPVNNRIRLAFSIEDNGFGISAEKQTDIFEPFSRDYTDRTKAIAGTGLGLAISSQLVAAMGGKIQLESELGVGSRFYFELEFELGEPIVQQPASSEPRWNSESLRGLRILVVEDNEMNAFIAENFLRKVGAAVELAGNGQEALDRVTGSPDGHYDLVLMDILMPVMDGYEATRRIKQLGSDYARRLPIVALSANAFNEDVEISLSHGMQAHLAKPIDIDALYQTILRLTGRPAPSHP